MQRKTELAFLAFLKIVGMVVWLLGFGWFAVEVSIAAAIATNVMLFGLFFQQVIETVARKRGLIED